MPPSPSCMFERSISQLATSFNHLDEPLLSPTSESFFLNVTQPIDYMVGSFLDSIDSPSGIDPTANSAGSIGSLSPEKEPEQEYHYQQYQPFIEMVHKTDYQCKAAGCSQILTSQAALQAHKLTHASKPKPFMCPKCPQSFSRSHGIRF